MNFRLNAVFAILALLSTTVNAAPFLLDTILAMVVGDNEYCPRTPANITCNYFTAPIQLFEYNAVNSGAAPVQNISLPSLSLSANDWYLGQMQLCGDGSCAVFAAQEAAPFSNVNYPGRVEYVGGVLTRPYINGNRVLVQLKPDGTVDTSTKIDAANYDGIIKGICAQDTSGFWIAGNATGNKGIIHMNTSAVNTHRIVHQNSACGGGSCYTGCHARDNTLYLVRTQAAYAYVDTPNPLFGQNLKAAFTVIQNPFFSGSPYYGRELISNAARNIFWFTEPYLGQIYRGANPAASGGMVLLTGAVGVRGIALSRDETILYFCQQKTISWMPSNGGAATVLQTITAPALEFRGLVIPPISCVGLPAGFVCNSAGTSIRPCTPGTAGINCATTCGIGQYSLAGQATCTTCPGGVFGAATGLGTPACSGPVVCPQGQYALPGAVNSNILDPATCTLCPAGQTSHRGSILLSDCFPILPSTTMMPLPFKADTILAMVVGDDEYCPRAPANGTCLYFTAPIRLNEYSGTTPDSPGLVQSWTLPGVTMSANDFYLGQMQPCADGSCAVFAAQEVAPYTNVNYPGRVGYTGGVLTRPYIDGNRVMVRINPNGNIDYTTKIDATNYDGIIKGVCALNGTGFWIAGNATGNKGIIYMANGAVNTHTIIHQNSACVGGGSCYTGCHARSDTMYFLRTQAVYAYVDTPNPLYGQNYYAPITVSFNPFFSSAPYYARELISNKLGNLFWFTEPFLGQVYTNAHLTEFYHNARAPTVNGGLTLLSILSNTGVTTVGIRGIALSPDETRLYLVTLKTLAWVPSTGGIVTVLQTLTAPSLEFRGLVTPPTLCRGLPAGFTCNAAGTAGVPCLPGTYGSTGGVCLPCPGGSFGKIAGAVSIAVCTSCPAGISCPPGSNTNTIVCPAGSFCVANRGPVACNAGVFCPAGTRFEQNNNAPCPAGMYCPAGVAPERCPSGTFSSLTGQTSSSTCTNCPAGTFMNTLTTPSSAICTNCPFGTYSSTIGAVNNTFCLECSAGKWCVNGATALDPLDCPAGWYCGGPGRPTGFCPGGYYSPTLLAQLPATCLPCGAGIFCPPASTNNTTPCPSGFECPNLVAPRPCGAGFFQDQEGQSVCKLCANGVISSQTGAKECKICPMGSYAQTGQLAFECNLCPANTYSTVTNANSRSVCTACPLSTWSAPGSSKCMALEWTKLQVGLPLVGRSFGAVANNLTAMVAVGGKDESGSISYISLGLDTRNLQVVETPLQPGASSATLDGAANAPHPSDGSTYLFGGANSNGAESNELWLLSASTNGVPSLTSITPTTSTRPSARKLAGMAYLSNCNTIAGACLVLVGGQSGSTIRGDVWVFSLTSRVWSQPQSGGEWNILTGAPSPRYGHTVVAAPNASMVFVIGGMTAAGASNDVFALSPSGFGDVYESEMINLALGKQSFISANDARLGRRGAIAANDGNIATFFNQNFNPGTTCTNPSSALCTSNMCTLTPIGGTGTTADYGGAQGTNSPWWGIDLGSEQQIDLINLYMRNPAVAGGQYTYDFPMGKSPNPVIYASNSNSTAASTCPNSAPSCPYTSIGAGCPTGTQLSAQGCVPTSFAMPASIVSGGPTRLLSDGLRARYLWLVLPGNPRILSLCEFQVFQKKPWIWRTLSAVSNVALFKKATLSTTLSGWGDGQALRAVDGIAANNMNAPFTFAHTEGNDVPNPWWQVDLGAPKDILYINVFGRGDCCTDRNTGISWTISSGTDYRYGTTCTSAPANISPLLSDPLADRTKIQFGPLMWWGAPINAFQTAPQYKSFPCKVRGRYVTAWKAPGWTNGAIMLGEVEVFASNFLDMPPARFGMSSTVHGGCIILFGGADTNGFRTNELRMFDMLQTKWLPVVTAIGTPPTGRTGGFLSTLVESTLQSPSYRIGLFGGFSNTDQLNDVSLLTLPQCPMYDTTGVDGPGTVCSHYNTVCYVKCVTGATSVNGNNPLVCQYDGSWRGANPPCVFSRPGYPTSVTAATDANGIVTVSWSPPTSATGGSGGFGPTPFTAYRVTTVPGEIYEEWSTTGRFAAPIAPLENPVPIGSSYLGGNWYKLIEKNGPSIDVNTPALQTQTSNTWDFFRSPSSGSFFLRLDSDLSRNNWFDQNENMVVYRSWPSTVNQAGSWAIETFVSMDQETITSSGSMNNNLALLDMSEYFGRGVIEWYAGVRNVGGTNFEIGWESSINTFNFWTNTNTATLARTYAIYVRIERDASVFPVQFKSYYKLNRGDAWTKFGVTATVAQARNLNLDPPNIRPALISRNWAGAARCVGLFSYFRIGPITCNYAGSQRYVSSITTSALMYGLTRGVTYSFTVEAQTKYGWSRLSDPSQGVTIPFPSTPLEAPLILTSPSTPITVSSLYGGGYEGFRAVDGNVGSFWHSVCSASTTTGGQWLQLDLGSTRDIGLIRFTERQDCCQARANYFQVWVGDAATWWNFAAQAPTTGYEQCDPSRYNNMISTVAGFSVSFPCFRVGSAVPIRGRYVVIRKGSSQPFDLCFHVAEVQVSSFQSSASIAQGKSCTMSTVQTPNVCSFALDGSGLTFAQAFSTNTQGWLTVDLGIATAVKSITVQARTDVTTPDIQQSLDGFTFRIGDVTPITAAYNQMNLVCNGTYANWLRNSPAVPYNSPSMNAGLRTTFDCVAQDSWSWRNRLPAVGRFVTMVVPAKASSALHIAELQIIPENIVLVSAGKRCALSSECCGNPTPYPCSSALDGNPANFAHTNNDLDNFLMIDLGSSTAVRLVKIINRQDCCQGRLNGFDFYIGDSPNFRQNQKCDRSVIKPLFDAATGWTSVFQCSLTGRYAILQVPNSPDSVLNVGEIQVFAANYCPQRTAVGATQIGGSVCTGAGYGEVCSFVCLPGWVVVSGGLSSTCGGDAWDDAPLVCAPPCPLLAPPTYVESCQQTFVIEDFNIPGALNRFYSTNPTVERLALPADSPPQGSTWFQLDGVLQASAVLSCNSDLHLVSSSEKLYNNDQGFTVTGSVATQTRAGIVFRAFDDANLMRVWIDVNLGYMALERVQNGGVRLIADAFSSVFYPDVFHSVSVSVLNANINISVNGIEYIVTSDKTFNFGAAGFYAQTSARFDDFVYSSSCTSCSGMTDGDVCTFSCSEGLITVGPVARTCSGTVSLATVTYVPSADTTPMFCTLAAPTFLPATLFILENSIKNANVGDPLVAFSTSPDFQVQFQILQTYETKAYWTPSFNVTLLPDNSLFWVDVCSGQVKLRRGGVDVLNYEGVNTYTITVRAFVSGFAGAESVRNISISVLNIDEKPVVNPVSVTMFENAALIPGTESSSFVWQNLAGSSIGLINQWDPENSTVFFTITADSTSGRVSLNNDTGLISVSNSFFNSVVNATESASFSYETQPNVFTLYVSATQKNNSAFTASSTFIITLLDANDPPLIERNQILRLVDWNQPLSSAGFVASYDEDVDVAFNNGTTYSLVSGSNCGQTTRYPTVDDSVGGSALFSINPATGEVILDRLPNGAWTSITSPIIFSGRLTRKVYEICVKTLDVFGGSDTQKVTISITADLPDTAIIKNVTGLSTTINTQGGDTITFGGINFWPAGVQPSNYLATYSNGIRSYSPVCQFPSGSVIVCTTLPGFDFGYTWSITLNPQISGASPILSEIDLLMSYAAPSVTDITATSSVPGTTHKTLPTTTAATVVITGSNFGPSNSNPVFYYGNQCVNLAGIQVCHEFECRVTTWTHTSITCSSASGVGKDLRWELRVGRQSASSDTSSQSLLLAYAPPIITSVTGSGAGVSIDQLDTVGKELVDIAGDNFGPTSITWRVGMNSSRRDTLSFPGYLVVPKFGGPTGDLLTFADCVIQSPTKLSCSTVGGVGVNHRVSIIVAGQEQVALWPPPSGGSSCSGLCYRPPILTSISGVGAKNADTAGDQLVIIKGRYFGPKGFNAIYPASIGTVCYGHIATAPCHYIATNCQVTVDADTVSEMTCLTAPGVGKDLEWSVTIGTQLASFATPLLSSYSAPQVFTFTGPGSNLADTLGDEKVIITGKNFGPADAYTNALLRVIYFTDLTDGGSSFLSVIPSVSYVAARCTVAIAHVTLDCYTVKGAGEALDWQVTVDSQDSKNPTTNYAPPKITDVTYPGGGRVIAANVNGGEVVSLIGRYFGPVPYGNTSRSLVQLVTYGKVGSEFIATNWTAVSDSLILVTLPPGIGTDLFFMVQVADQMSPASEKTFSYAIPVITQVSPTRSSTFGGATITVDAKNLPLLDPTASFSVLLGQKRSDGGFGVFLKFNVPQNDMKLIADKTNVDGSVRGAFQLPTNFAGKDLGVAIAVSQGQASNIVFITNATADNSVFSFSDPVINSVVVTRGLFVQANASGDQYLCPSWPNPSWSCNSSIYQLTINGANFGKDPRTLSATDDPDGVLRSVAVQVGSLWSEAAPSAGAISDLFDEIYLQSWDHIKIVAFVKQTSGTVRVRLETQSTYLQPRFAKNAVQTATFAFANLNPTISSITGATTNVPTAGSSTSAITITVDGLTGATSFKIFVGGNHINGTEANIECTGPIYPCTSSDLLSYLTQQTAQNAGQAVIKFYPPAGQGLDQPVVAVVYQGSSIKPSNQGFTISYAQPLITGFQVIVPPATLSSPSAAVVAVSSGKTIFAGTDGTTRVRIIGTNFGTRPEVTVGDTRIIVPFSGITSCDSAGLVHTCLEFFVPEGEGNGKGGSDSMFEQYTDLNQGRDGTNLPKGFTVSSSTPVSVGKPQSSNMVPFSYAPSTITMIRSSSFPTQGGSTLTIYGTNFGKKSSDILRGANPLTVNLTQVGFDSLVCTNVQRISHTELTCVLPPGAGTNIAVVASVANVLGDSATGVWYKFESVGPPTLTSTQGYDRPVITRAWVLPSTYATSSITSSSFAMALPKDGSKLNASTAGGEWIVLEGINFGEASPSNCAFMAWWYRDSTQSLTCDNTESFQGEGEVPLSNSSIIWGHNLIAFRSIPGLGQKEIALVVRRNTQGLTPQNSNAIRFAYNKPVISSIQIVDDKSGKVSTGVNTEGCDTVTITGLNFGPTTINTKTSPFNSYTLSGISLINAPSIPTAYLVVSFASSCVVLGYNLLGQQITTLLAPTSNGLVSFDKCSNPNPKCSYNGFLKQTDTSITFYSPPGVGANKLVTVAVVDQTETPQTSRPPFLVSYKPPEFDRFDPNPVKVDAEPWYSSSKEDGTFSKFAPKVDIYGFQFGNYELADVQQWSILERSIKLTIAGQQCADMVADKTGALMPLRTRKPIDRAGKIDTVITCGIDFRSIPAGVNNVSISIAGQSGYNSAWSPPVDKKDFSAPPFGAFIVACERGSYAAVGETCLPCPGNFGAGFIGADCDGFKDFSSFGNLTFKNRFSYPRPRAGYYNLNSSDRNTLKWGSDGESQMPACPDGFQDAKRDVCIVPCDPPESCLADNVCSFGYASKSPMWKCSNCDTGFYRRNVECVKCPDSPWALVIGFTLLVIFAGIVGFVLSQKGVNIAVISIGLDFFQVLAIFASSGVKWPPIVKELLHILSAFNLNIEIVAPECIVPDLSYKAKFWFIMLLPLSVGGLLLGGVFTALALYKACVLGQRKKSDLFSHLPGMINSCLSLLYILYLYLTRTVFDVFNCTPTFPPDGRLYLTVANHEQCGIPGGTQLTLMPYAVAGLIVYAFGYPAFIASILYKNRELCMLDQLLRAKGTGDDRLSNPNAFELRMTYGRQYFQFKPDQYFWILAVILRKFFISVTAVVFSKNSSFQMAACLLVMFLAYSAQVMVRPYLSAAEFDDVIKAHIESSYTSAIHARLRTQIAKIESRGKKKVRKNLLSFDGTVDRSAILGVLTGWFFNYNTIEQIMIFCAVIVCLMGIMYQANTSSVFYPGALDGVTAVVMITIIFAIVYYITVVVTEMVILYNEDHNRKIAERTKARKGDDKTKKSQQSGRLVNEDGEINTGRMDAMMNPLFLNTGDSSSKGGVGGSSSAIAQMNSPPPVELWQVFRQEYINMERALTNSSSGSSGSSSSGSPVRDSGDDMTSKISVNKKKGFAPVTTPN